VITHNQAESLKAKSIDLEIFAVTGTGFKGYFRNIFILKRYLKNNSFDIIHAHYALSAFVATLAGARPLVVSLMGSDVKAKRYYKYILKVLSYFFWNKTIVKSQDMKDSLKIKNVLVIPNGVDFNKFVQIPKETALSRTSWDRKKRHILFAADPGRTEKNYILAKKVVALLGDNELELNHLGNEPYEIMQYLYNAADVVLLTSHWEGSPNVIKEAMACNRPIVCTDVGDVEENFRGISGCFICSYQPEDVAEKIELALQLESTDARGQISNLSSDIIADRIIEVYQSILKN
jgi:glycosyltransferase involved in cell wall biosynthesis